MHWPSRKIVAEDVDRRVSFRPPNSSLRRPLRGDVP